MWPRLAAWEQDRFADRLAVYAVQSTAGASELTVRKLSRLGAPAIEPLAALAASQRGELAESAQEAISNQLAAWEIALAERGDAREFSQQLQILSAALERHAGQFGGSGQLWAQKLARRLVAHCDHLPPDAAWVVLARCEVPLSAPTSPAARPEQLAETIEPPAVEAEAPATPTMKAAPPADSRQKNAMARGDISVVPPTVEPARGEARSVPTTNTLRNSDNASDLPPSAPPPETATTTAVAATPAPAAAVVDVPSPQDMRHLTRKLRELADRELVARLASAEKFEALAARRVLRERGYSDAIVDMTRRLEQLPAAERREAIDRAASLPAAEARRLLRWFVADEDAEVRLQALTMLATTGDPQLPEIARRRAVEDADPRVAELATQLMKQR